MGSYFKSEFVNHSNSPTPLQCDSITEVEYEAMSNLPESEVVYVCRRCCRDNTWRQQLVQAVQDRIELVIEEVRFSLTSPDQIDIQKYNSVRSLRTFENDMFDCIDEVRVPGAVKTFAQSINEAFPWYAVIDSKAFEVQTPIKTPKKVHWFNKEPDKTKGTSCRFNIVD
eukprot:sb/3472298/